MGMCASPPEASRTLEQTAMLLSFTALLKELLPVFNDRLCAQGSSDCSGVRLVKQGGVDDLVRNGAVGHAMTPTASQRGAGRSPDFFDPILHAGIVREQRAEAFIDAGPWLKGFKTQLGDLGPQAAEVREKIHDGLPRKCARAWPSSSDELRCAVFIKNRL